MKRALLPEQDSTDAKKPTDNCQHRVCNCGCMTQPRIQLIPDSVIEREGREWRRCRCERCASPSGLPATCTQMLHVVMVLLRGPVCSECSEIVIVSSSEEEEPASSLPRKKRRTC